MPSSFEYRLAPALVLAALQGVSPFKLNERTAFGNFLTELARHGTDETVREIRRRSEAFAKWCVDEADTTEMKATS